MKLVLTNQQILSLNDAIAALDGRKETQILDGKPVDLLRVPKLTHNSRWLLARNVGKLQAVIADFNHAKSALINQHSDGHGAISAASPNFNAFAQDFEKLTQQEVELDLDAITLPDLRLEENEAAGAPVQIAVLHALAPLIAAP